MPKFSWPEIRQNAIRFSHRWRDARDERSEAQTFWNEFFEIFGLDRKIYATFEEHVRSLKNTHQRIDLFWKGMLLAEHKSAGESLEKAQSQAFDYIQQLAATGRAHEAPRYVAVSDFARIVLFDLQPELTPDAPQASYERTEIVLEDLHRHVEEFGFLIGQQKVRYRVEDDANLVATQLMADLHDTMADAGYAPHSLERLLVRILFCLFADDTGIFEPNQFESYLRNRSKGDGSDLGAHLLALFQILNTPEPARSKVLDDELAAFPYINGDLFEENLPLAPFNRDMRNRLFAAAEFNWGRISPAVFGALFQGIMDDKSRRKIGAHYTSERDILKVIRPLFLDALEDELARIRQLRRRRRQRLEEFQAKLASLKFLDPACGCGNFLVVAYRELRRIELRALELMHDGPSRDRDLPIGETYKLSKVDVDQFHGIEIEEWPTRIAETALWLTDHQMNTELSRAFGNQFRRIPLKKSPHIHFGNALRMDWGELLPADQCNYVLGNPPFIGKHLMDAAQKSDVAAVWDGAPGTGSLDYVTCWYKVAAKYIERNPGITCAFVSTNSVSQGEQAGILWSRLFRHGIRIHFAYRTFPWESEAKGKAHVHVVIVGFGRNDAQRKRIYHSRKVDGVQVDDVANISPYLTEGPDTCILPRSRPICDVPETIYGNKPTDGGHLLLDEAQREELLRNAPELGAYVRPMVSAEEYLHGRKRYCLWFLGANLAPLRASRRLSDILASVRAFREASVKGPTRELASQPQLFAEIRQPDTEYIVIPRHSSETRDYIPFGYFDSKTIVHDSCTALPNATPYHFGVLSSAMHMAWVRQICGRLESRYRYSTTLVYNNFPWPPAPPASHRTRVEACASAILETRESLLGSETVLASLYDPLYMPPQLAKAHRHLDNAVDRCYRKSGFDSESSRIAYLFEMHEQLTTPLAPNGNGTHRKKR